ncbi:DNA-directed RNA polymerase subunit beta [Pontibacillus salicampi]|uniref:DNA-directed RNA polymerase subunit beta n=1 Tax=Pontibacillus salicampi TaxID=1449801 RepID=A0ABV6LS79_9BACI
MPEKQKQNDATTRNERREENKQQKKQGSENKTKTKKVKKQDKQEDKQQKKVRRRLLPIWLRLIIVILLCTLALLGGIMIGYGVIGDGNPLDALKLETWQHIIDIVTKE